MNHSPDNFSDNDWDGGNLAWSEQDWRHYLSRNAAEIAQFSKFYFQHIDEDGRMDAAAHAMKWDSEDWIANLEDDAAPASEDDVYTVHRHPVLVVTRALFGAIQNSIDTAFNANERAARPLHCLERSLARAQSDACMAIFCVDAGECTLAVCHLKTTLAHLNLALGQLGALPKDLLPAVTRTLIFDLRELYLRVLNDCRSGFSAYDDED